MTYPQQQYPPQGYGQPQPYGAPQQQPQYAPPMPPAPAPQQQPPAQALARPAPALSTGGGNVGGSWPKMRHLQDCTVIFVPLRVDEDAKDQAGKPQPEAYFHLIVVDSPTGVIQYGDSQDSAAPKPLAWERATPCVFTNVNDYGWGPVNEIRNALAAGEEARVGVVERGTQGNKPYMITKPDKMVGGADRPDGTDRFQRAASVWNAAYAFLHGDRTAFANPDPRALLAPPAAPVAQVAYGAPQQPAAQPYGQYAPAMQAVQPGYVPTPYGQAPAAAVHPDYAAAVQQPGAQIAYGIPPQSAPPAPQPYPQGYGQYAPAPAQPQSTGNPAFDAYLASLPESQRPAALAQYMAQAAGQPQPPQGGPGI